MPAQKSKKLLAARPRPQIALIRVRQATVSLFSRYLDDPGYRPAKDLHQRLQTCQEASQAAQRRHPGRSGAIELYPADLEGPEKFVAVMSDITEQLTRLDRYERRALSRRKFAMRELDTARRLQRGRRDYRHCRNKYLHREIAFWQNEPKFSNHSKLNCAPPGSVFTAPTRVGRWRSAGLAQTPIAVPGCGARLHLISSAWCANVFHFHKRPNRNRNLNARPILNLILNAFRLI